jgi:hypothetical protein
LRVVEVEIGLDALGEDRQDLAVDEIEDVDDDEQDQRVPSVTGDPVRWALRGHSRASWFGHGSRAPLRGESFVMAALAAAGKATCVGRKRLREHRRLGGFCFWLAICRAQRLNFSASRPVTLRQQEGD